LLLLLTTERSGWLTAAALDLLVVVAVGETTSSLDTELVGDVNSTLVAGSLVVGSMLIEFGVIAPFRVGVSGCCWSRCDLGEVDCDEFDALLSVPLLLEDDDRDD
jgi:hypothetical protein